jgi:hypothetical protein
MMRRSSCFGSTASFRLVLVHLALIAIVTVAMVTTLPTIALHV